MKTNTVQDIPKWNSHILIKYPQYKVNGTFIHKKFTITHFTSLYLQKLHRNSLHFTTHFTSLHSLSLMVGSTPCVSSLSLSSSSSSPSALIMILSMTLSISCSLLMYSSCLQTAAHSSIVTEAKFYSASCWTSRSLKVTFLQLFWSWQ